MKRYVAMCLVLLAACKPSGPGGSAKALKSYGARVAEDGEVARVTPSPDGSYLAFLGQVERPKDLGVPEGILVGILELVPSDGSGPAHQLLGGVTNMEGAFGFSPDGKVLAALKSFRFATHSGTFEVVKVGGKDAVQLGDDCSGFAFAPDSKHLAWVCASGAFLGDGEGANPRKLTDSAATVDFSRDGSKLLVRKLAQAGGDLVLFDVAGKGGERTLAKAVGDYGFSPDGADVAFTTHSADPRGGWDLKLASTASGTPRALGEGVSSFRFSPDGKWIGYIAGVTPRKAFGDLYVAPAHAGGDAVKAGDRVEEFSFSPASDAVAFLQDYDANARSGTLALKKLGSDEKAMVLHKPCKGFGWSPHGKYLAYSALVLKPAVSLDLDIVELASLKPGASQPDGGVAWATGSRKVATGSYGYEFLGDDKIIYRSDCIMEGRACDLYLVPTDRPATPARLTGGVWRFSISKDGTRMLLTYPRVDSETVADLGAMNLSGYGGVMGLDHSVELGAAFLDPKGERASYGVIDKRRRGVYVAKVPLPPPGELPPSLEPPGFKATYRPDGGK